MINEFRGKYYFLSNFYPVEIEYDGRIWPTSEHIFAAMKTENRGEQEMIRRAKEAGEAKKLGRGISLRADWDDVKINLMKEILEIKFAIPEMKELLLATGEEELIEGNSWRDRFWGTVDGQGLNWLGKLLMEVRSELRYRL